MALRSHGISMDTIQKAITIKTGIGQERLNEIFDNAVKRNQQYYNYLIDFSGLTRPRSIVSDRDIDAIRRQTQNELRNITRSMGFVVTRGGQKVLLEPGRAYQWALDQAALQIMSGTTDYNKAIRGAVRRLADSGLRRVDYESGHVDQIDVAARRAIMTGINQLCQRYAEQSMEYLNTDLVEVSAHKGARNTGTGPENHQQWQGKVYRWSEKPRVSVGDYPDFIRETGYGTGPGLGGWNCRHHFYPFVEGVSERAYTDKELAKMDNPPFNYQGRTYDQYAASQKQRQIERTIRKYTREQLAAKASGLTEDAQTAGARIAALRQEYEAFSKAAGLPTQPERMKVLYT